jgi:hypothetical protein
VIAAMILCCGCTVTTTEHYSVLSTMKVGADTPPPAGMPSDAVEGATEVIFALGLIPVGPLPRVQDAVDDALAKGRGNLLTDVVVENYITYYVLWSRAGSRVRGRAVTAREPAR